MPYKDPEKRRECLRRYNEQHAAEIREYKRIYANNKYADDPEHREKVKADRRDKYSKNRDAESAYKTARWFAKHEENKAKNRASKKRCYWANPEHYRKRQAEYSAEWKVKNPEKWAAQLARNKARAAANPEERRKYWREYVKRHPWRKMINSMFTRTKNIMRGAVKHERKSVLLGCTPAELRSYIQAQWTEGMSWDTYGKGIGKWTLDHKTPLAAWDLNNPEHQAAALHFTNLQPMWWSDNCSKSSFHNGKKHWHDKSK